MPLLSIEDAMMQSTPRPDRPDPNTDALASGMGSFIDAYSKAKERAIAYKNKYELERQKLDMDMAVTQSELRSAKTEDDYKRAQLRGLEQKNAADKAENDFKESLRRDVMDDIEGAFDKAPGNTPEEKHQFLEDAVRKTRQAFSGQQPPQFSSFQMSPITEAAVPRAKDEASRMQRLKDRLSRFPAGEVDLGGVKFKTGKGGDDYAMEWARKNPKSIPFLLNSPNISEETRATLQAGYAAWRASEGIDKVDTREIALYPQVWTDERIKGLELNPEAEARVFSIRDGALARQRETDAVKAEESRLRRVATLEKDINTKQDLEVARVKIRDLAKAAYQKAADLGPAEGESWSDYGANTLQPLKDDVAEAQEQVDAVARESKAYRDELNALKAGSPQATKQEASGPSVDDLLEKYK